MAGTSFVALTSHQCAFIAIVAHLVNSPQVTVLNWFSLLADTMTELPIRVLSIHRINHATSALLPIPRPELTAIRSASMSSTPWFALMWFVMSRSTLRCHLRGPLNLASGVFSTPHGNMNSTKLSGSSLIWGLHSFAISDCSSSALYIGFCISLLSLGLHHPHLLYPPTQSHGHQPAPVHPGY